PASLEAILESILALVEPECRKRKITIVREGFSAEPSRYLLDEGQIQQAIFNITINAIQAMEKGGTLTCRLGRLDSFVTVEVSDTGPGIPPEVRERMFDLFYTTRQGGTGLGLYLTQRIVAEHKGYIEVRTAPGGTTFRVALPAETAP
ncbi:MAG: ATP-binding protein, partial [Planctomycetota bacterium]